MFGVIIQQTISLRNVVHEIHTVQIQERTIRESNTQTLLDHEGRIRILEVDQTRHQQEIKDWTDQNFKRKQ